MRAEGVGERVSYALFYFKSASNSGLPDTRQNGFLSKANMHIHFVQFDIQASDGVNTGFGYEQSIRPFTVEGELLTQPAARP